VISPSKDEPKPASRQSATEPVELRPEDAPKPPETQSVLIMADSAALRPTSESAKAAPATSLAGSPSSTDGGEVLRASLGKEPPPAPEPRPARVRRATPEEQSQGEILFAKEWVPDDPRSHAGDGLGPVYNDTSCVACHSLGAPGGAGPENKNVVLVTASQNGCGPSSSPGEIVPGLRVARGALLHRYSTDPGYPAWLSRLLDPPSDAQVKAASSRREDPVASRIQALRERSSPDRRRRDPSSNSPSVNGFNLTFVERNTPTLFGVGRIDEIPSELIIAMAESQPREVRGRVARTREGRI